MVTRYPRACSNLASEAAIIPFPKEELTPPVTKIYLVFAITDSGLYYCYYLSVGKSTNLNRETARF